MAKAGKNIPESGAGSVPVKDLRLPADWRDELGLDRQRADLINGDLGAWWQHYATGEYHEIPRAYWRGERAVEFANGGWGWLLLGGLFSSEGSHSCAIYMAPPPGWSGPKQGTASQPEQPAEQLEQPRRSSKRKQKEVIRRVRMAYPDGVDGVPTAEVFKQIRYSSWRTVNRALGREPLPKK